MLILQNETLRLRAPEPTDLEWLYRWENDSEVWVSGTTLTPFSRYVLGKYLETAHLDIFETHQLRLMIELIKQPGVPIGTIDLFDFDAYHNRAGIGILIAEKSNRRKGYARQSLQLLIDYCFNILGLNQLYCNIDPLNQQSVKLFTSMGFSIVGLKKRWTRRGTVYHDEYLLQLLNPAFT
ncbi:MAG: GNAT family protein [Bacteroidales bacterium]|nr:GNAT family protein [Bacteroidales bacterium]HPO64929.1 GNAT family protein [Bacteroidales bacterium]